jgi:hypothetical protein
MNGPMKLLKKRRMGTEAVLGINSIGIFQTIVYIMFAVILQKVPKNVFAGLNCESSFHFNTHLLINPPKYPPSPAKVTTCLFKHAKCKLIKCLWGGHDFLIVSNQICGAGSKWSIYRYSPIDAVIIPIWPNKNPLTTLVVPVSMPSYIFSNLSSNICKNM